MSHPIPEPARPTQPARRLRSFRSRRRTLLGAASAIALAAAVGTSAAQAHEPAHASSTPARSDRPTVVLVHGAFADASSWSGVVERLQQKGYPVRAVANPLRGVASDAAAVRAVMDTIDGPLVLVGHSYGGAVIGTAAAAGDADVKALVYVAAFQPAVGESLADLTQHPVADPAPTLPLAPVPITNPDGTPGADLYLAGDQFRTAFAADVDPDHAAVMAASQRPLSAAAFSEPSPRAAWTDIPSWAVIATQDNAIGADLERFMARRAGSTVLEVKASHAVAVSRPQVVTGVIEKAARSTH